MGGLCLRVELHRKGSALTACVGEGGREKPCGSVGEYLDDCTKIKFTSITGKVMKRENIII